MAQTNQHTVNLENTIKWTCTKCGHDKFMILEVGYCCDNCNRVTTLDEFVEVNQAILEKLDKLIDEHT